MGGSKNFTEKVFLPSTVGKKEKRLFFHNFSADGGEKHASKFTFLGVTGIIMF
ncbi:MAG: hypothetical protein LBR79_00770 [Oscillospiraceae bacterium]|jgi:hypothetical protein|nr:hypothetical protein [Oscillospiraceae bacterium]